MVLVVIDFQERLCPHIQGIEEILKNARKLIKACHVFEIPVIATEQIKIGETKSEIKELLSEEPIKKSTFSCLKNQIFREKIESLKPKKVLITGIEAHICVLQTALDFKKEGFEVEVVVDAIGSRKNLDKEIALKILEKEGVSLTTSEIFMYQVLEGAEHPKFKEILKIVKE